jgi:hypothetical protein
MRQVGGHGVRHGTHQAQPHSRACQWGSPTQSATSSSSGPHEGPVLISGRYPCSTPASPSRLGETMGEMLRLSESDARRHMYLPARRVSGEARAGDVTNARDTGMAALPSGRHPRGTTNFPRYTVYNHVRMVGGRQAGAGGLLGRLGKRCPPGCLEPHLQAGSQAQRNPSGGQADSVLYTDCQCRA